MSDETTSVVAGNARRWALQLVLAAVVIGLGTGALFYFTTRNIFGRTWDPQSPPADPMANVVSLEHGLTVYAANCAMCHGASGLGDGTAAAQLNPKPRDFSSGWFKIGDTRSGLPSDRELETSIRRGLFPLMPPWPKLSEGEVKSLALAVRHLAIEGVVSSRLAHDQKTSREEVLKIAHGRLDSGQVIVLPPRPAKIDLARGKTFFLNNCAACHDPDGRGRLREDLVDNNENPIRARDLTSGKFKGGNNVEDIAMRMLRGIPGSPMPAMVEITPDDLWSTAEYVHTLFEQALAGK